MNAIVQLPNGSEWDNTKPMSGQDPSAADFVQGILSAEYEDSEVEFEQSQLYPIERPIVFRVYAQGLMIVRTPKYAQPIDDAGGRLSLALESEEIHVELSGVQELPNSQPE